MDSQERIGADRLWKEICKVVAWAIAIYFAFLAIKIQRDGSLNIYSEARKDARWFIPIVVGLNLIYFWLGPRLLFYASFLLSRAIYHTRKIFPSLADYTLRAISFLFLLKVRLLYVLTLNVLTIYYSYYSDNSSLVVLIGLSTLNFLFSWSLLRPEAIFVKNQFLETFDNSNLVYWKTL